MQTEVDAELVNHSQYIGISGDPTVEDLLEKYDDIISPTNKVIGFNKSYKNSYYLCQLMADLYYDMEVEEWGDDYGNYVKQNLNPSATYYVVVEAIPHTMRPTTSP